MAENLVTYTMIADNGSRDHQNVKYGNFLYGDSVANRRRAGSNDKVSLEEETVNSSDGDSVADQRGARSSDEISSEEEAAVFEQKGESLEKSNGKEYKITSMVAEGETYKADDDANKNRI